MNIFPFTLEFAPAGAAALPVARFPFIVDGGAVGPVSCVISSRAAGNMVYSPCGENPERRALYEALGIGAGPVYALNQVHSREVRALSPGSPPEDDTGDGLLSADPGVWLSVTVADCLPVYLYDTGSGAFGLLHSGWRGTGIVRRALDLMGERWGTRTEEIAAVLGPCIRGCCYRVDRGRARDFEGEFGGSGGPYPLGPVSREEAGEFFIDLPAANARILARAGVRQLAVCQDCTFTALDLGSFRREGPGYTRMAGLIGRF